MNRKSRPLAPAERSPRTFVPTPLRLPEKRHPVPVACDRCRNRKLRCDGNKPACTRCRENRAECSYAPQESTAAGVAKLKSRALSLQSENTRLWELFRLLSTLPRNEVDEIIGHIRSAEHPVAILRLARDSSPSLQDGQGPDVAPVVPPWDNPRLLAIDLRALANSRLRVSARPWTLIAGDGIVSDLISSFFAWDDPFFFPFIHRDAFLKDMRRNDVKNAAYCSPFLVNAICASRYYTSRVAKAYSGLSGDNLGFRFFNEAKKLWTLEGDRASLPSVQALAIMFTVSAYRGTDRQGSMYRLAAYEMMRRLNMPSMFNHPVVAEDSSGSQREIISKACWGLFCFESIVSYVYLQQSLIPPPTIPRCFEPAGPHGSNVDFHDNIFTSESPPPPFVRGILSATCDLSEFMYRVMQWNADTREPGNEHDVAQRRQLKNEVGAWRNRLPNHMRADQNFTPQTCFLNIYADEVLISIIRPLHPSTIFDEASDATAGDLLIQFAVTDVDFSRRWIQQYTLNEYSCMTLCGMYNAVLILVGFLDNQRVQVTFVEVCMMIRQTALDFPMARFILQGVLALAWSLDVAVPARALPYLQGLGGEKEELRDLPLAFALPQTEAIRGLLGGEAGADTKVLAEMGKLLSKWSALCIE